MKKLLKYGAAMAVAGLMASTSASAATMGTMGALAANAGTAAGQLTIGDKTFDNFSISVSSIVGGLGQTTAASAAAINVSLGTDANGNYFITFQGGISSGVGGDVDIRLQYSVTASGGFVINAIDQAFNFGAQGAGGGITIAETASSGNFLSLGGAPVANSTVGFLLGQVDQSDPPAELVLGDQLSVPNLTTVFVQKDIHLTAVPQVGGPPNNIVEATIIVQSFHQSGGVPDGGSTLLLLGGAMSCLSFFGLRRKS